MLYLLRRPSLVVRTAGWMALPLHLLRRTAHAMAENRRHAIAYRDLREVDAHTLRDIGLSHRAAAEASRVPWH